MVLFNTLGGHDRPGHSTLSLVTKSIKSPWISRLPTPDYMRSRENLISQECSVSLVEPGMFEISVVRGQRVPALLASHRKRPMNGSSALSDIEKISADRKSISMNASPSLPIAATWSKARDIAFIINVFFAQFLGLGALAQTVAPILILSAQFNVTDPAKLSWYSAAYSLTTGTFILPAGRLGDMYGHKKMFLFGWLCFAAFSVMSGAAVYSGPILFVTARALQGIGPAILIPNAMALIGRNYVGLKKNLVFSFFGAGGPTGFIVGNVMTSVFAQYLWWPWAFYALGIVCALVFCMTIMIVPNDDSHPTEATLKAAKPKFDYVGALTGVSGLVLINYSWNQAAVVGWDRQCVIIISVGLACLLAFTFAELRLTRFPLIPLRGLRIEAGFALACITLGWGGHGIWLYYWFWFSEYLRGYSPLQASAQIAPAAASGLIFAFMSGIMMMKTKPAFVLLCAMSCFLAGMVLIATAPIHQLYWTQTFLSAVIAPGGMNLSFPAGTIILSGALTKEHQGIAASLVAVCVNYSISIGLGFAGTIDRHVSQHKGVTDALKGYRGAWYFAIGLDGLGLLISLWFMWRTRREPWGAPH